jgi:hypothetical protein
MKLFLIVDKKSSVPISEISGKKIASSEIDVI